jgi:uridylate kinase
MKKNRVLLKLSGEALAKDNGTGIDFNKVLEIAKIIKDAIEKDIEIAIVVGGGNFWRGRSNTMMDSCTSDHIGMLATTMNALSVGDALTQVGCDNRVMTSIEMREIAEPYVRDKALKNLSKKRVVVFGCGTGSPFFSTDTAAALRAAEIKADIILKATNVDYVYTKDPRKFDDYEIIKETSHLNVIKEKLRVMDLTAISLCMDNNIPIRIFNLNNKENLSKALNGEKIGTLIK